MRFCSWLTILNIFERWYSGTVGGVGTPVWCPSCTVQVLAVQCSIMVVLIDGSLEFDLLKAFVYILNIRHI